MNFTFIAEDMVLSDRAYNDYINNKNYLVMERDLIEPVINTLDKLIDDIRLTKSINYELIFEALRIIDKERIMIEVKDTLGYLDFYIDIYKFKKIDDIFLRGKYINQFEEEMYAALYLSSILDAKIKEVFLTIQSNINKEEIDRFIKSIFDMNHQNSLILKILYSERLILINSLYLLLNYIIENNFIDELEEYLKIIVGNSNNSFEGVIQSRKTPLLLEILSRKDFNSEIIKNKIILRDLMFLTTIYAKFIFYDYEDGEDNKYIHDFLWQKIFKTLKVSNLNKESLFKYIRENLLSNDIESFKVSFIKNIIKEINSKNQDLFIYKNLKDDIYAYIYIKNRKKSMRIVSKKELNKHQVQELFFIKNLYDNFDFINNSQFNNIKNELLEYENCIINNHDLIKRSDLNKDTFISKIFFTKISPDDILYFAFQHNNINYVKEFFYIDSIEEDLQLLNKLGI